MGGRSKGSAGHRRLLFVALAIAIFTTFRGAFAQEEPVDPGRVLTTPLQWEKVAGAPRDAKLQHAYGTLAIFYLDGAYAEVSASFIRSGAKDPVGLNLNEGFIVRLGSWTRADDGIIRMESREVLRALNCKTVAGHRECQPAPEELLPGPSTAHTCRVEGGSASRIASALYCRGLVLMQPASPIDLSDFPSIVEHLLAMQKVEDKSVAVR